MHKTISLDDLYIVETYDSKKMLETVHKLPSQCQEAYILSKKIDISNLITGNVTNIVISGMGGSSIAGDLIKALLEDELPIPIIVNKDYDLPNFVNENSFIVVISYSGETEEAISSFDNALKRGAKILTISSGGTLKELSVKNKIPHFELPAGFVPRAALAYLFFFLLEIFIKLSLIKSKDKDIESLINLLKFLQKSWKFDIPTEQNLAKKIAHRFYNKIPVIYTNSVYLSKVALRWKNQINENSKMLAHIGSFPELAHNEIAGFTKNMPVYDNLSIIFLTDPACKEVVRQVIYTKQIIQNYFTILEIIPFGETKIEKMFSLIYLGDFISVYLAFLYQQDPTPIHLIDKIKEKK